MVIQFILGLLIISVTTLDVPLPFYSLAFKVLDFLTLHFALIRRVEKLGVFFFRSTLKQTFIFLNKLNMRILTIS